MNRDAFRISGVSCEELATKTVQNLNEKGFCLDFVSGGELYCAKDNGFPTQNIYFHGNNKSDEERALALEFQVGGIILDGEMECSRVIERAEALRRDIDMMIEVEALDLGGGFAAIYAEEDDPISTEDVCRAIVVQCETEVMQRKLHLKTLLIEPGRSIIAEAGCTLYRAAF